MVGAYAIIYLNFLHFILNLKRCFKPWSIYESVAVEPLMFWEKVSELGTSESDNGNGSSLEGSGTSDFVVLAIHTLGAFTPLGFEFFEFFLFIALQIVEDFVWDTFLGITYGKGGESRIINLLFSLF